MSEKQMKCDLATRIDSMSRAGQPVDAEDLSSARSHREKCPDCRLDQAVLDSIAADGSSGALSELDDIAERRLVDNVLARSCLVGVEPALDRVPIHTSQRARNRWLAISASAIAVAATVALVAVWQLRSGPIREPANALRSRSTVESPIDGARLIVLAGDVRFGSAPARDGEAVVVGRAVETRNGRAVLSLPGGIALSIARDARLKVRSGEKKGLEVELDRGEILVSVEPEGQRSPFKVVTKHGAIEVKGTVFSVTACDDSVVVRMHRGEVVITQKSASPRRLGNGKAAALGAEPRSWSLSPAETVSARRRYAVLEGLGLVKEGLGPPAASLDIHADAADETVEPAGSPSFTGVGPDRSRVPSRAQIKREAQSHQWAGNWKAAARSWHKLISHYPGSAEAHTALVSLGQLEIEKLGRPARARRHFQKYLSRAGGGPLAQEALFGKARAFRALKDSEQEKKTLERFLERFPFAIQAPQAMRRLKKLEE